MQVSSFETEIKVIIVGDGRIGKTSLMTRFVDGTFYNQYMKTIGVDFLEKRMFVPAIHENVSFYLYDTAGQEEFNALTRTFYRGAGAAIVAFSTTDRASFLEVPTWIKSVRDECGRIPIVIVQTKIDLLDQAAVTPAEISSLGVNQNLRIFQVCSKDDLHVNEVFEQLCIEYVRRRRLLGGQLESPIRSAFDLTKDNTEANPDGRREKPTNSGSESARDRRGFLSCLIM